MWSVLEERRNADKGVNSRDWFQIAKLSIRRLHSALYDSNAVNPENIVMVGEPHKKRLIS